MYKDQRCAHCRLATYKNHSILNQYCGGYHMKDLTNTTAGMADPYWYEWTVGLYYALDMLIPDKNIKHVVFCECQSKC